MPPSPRSTTSRDERRSPQAREPLEQRQAEEQFTEILMAEEGGTDHISEQATEILMAEEGTDRISGLPDNILHSILLLLPGGTAEAVRTSVLAKRWRFIWAHLPELSFSGDCCRVEAAQAAYLAPTVNRLSVDMFRSSCRSRRVLADRVSAWLHLASKRLAGELRIPVPHDNDREHEVVLPVCEMATTIIMNLGTYMLRFALPPAGMFLVLATLTIRSTYVDGRELQGLLTVQCPRLKLLVLDHITLLDGARPLSINSNSLQRLEIDIIESDVKVEIVAPELQAFYPYYLSQFDIPASPKLSDVGWRNSKVYNPLRHSFGVAGRHIRRLVLATNASAVPLMQRFDTVPELVLIVKVGQGVQEYNRFLQETKILSKCKVLVLRLGEIEHALTPILMHLLRRCAGTRKLVIQLNSTEMDDYPCKSVWNCPCGWLENRKMNNIVFDAPALEEVEVKGHEAASQVVLRLMCKFSATFHKRVTFTALSERGFESICRRFVSIEPTIDKVEAST